MLPPPDGEQRRDAVAAAAGDAGDVDVEHVAPRLVAGVLGPVVVGGRDAGVVVEDVQAAERRDRVVHRGRDAVVVGHVGGHVVAPRRRRRRSPRPTSSPSATSATTTRAPSAANSSAATRPRPAEAPVINATLPSSRRRSSSSSLPRQSGADSRRVGPGMFATPGARVGILVITWFARQHPVPRSPDVRHGCDPFSEGRIAGSGGFRSPIAPPLTDAVPEKRYSWPQRHSNSPSWNPRTRTSSWRSPRRSA